MAVNNPLNTTILKLKSQYNQEDLPEFEIMRKRLAEQIREQEQTQREGLERGFARLGGGPAGAQIKAQQQLESQLGKQRVAAEESVSGQELSMRRQLAEAEKQRQFAVSEREAGQAFAKEQTGRQLDFARAEREAQQVFARGEREAGQLFVRGERESGQDFTKRMADLDMQFKDKVFSFEKESKLKELDMAEKQFALDKDIAEFNKQIAMMEANRPTDLMGSLFGPAFSTSGGPIGGALGMVAGPVGGLGGAITKPVAPVVNTVSNALSKFCFLKGTLFAMKDGSKKAVETIQLGDEMALGGQVYFIGSAITEDIYNYLGVYVTGSHAVFEHDEFIRVKDSPLAEKMELSQTLPIYFVSNRNHLILSNDILFSDFHESDNIRLSDEESLKELNDKIKNNEEVKKWQCK